MQMPTGVVMRRTAELVPYANNARTHTPEQVKQIAASIPRVRLHQAGADQLHNERRWKHRAIWNSIWAASTRKNSIFP
jgi:hypothetical protein